MDSRLSLYVTYCTVLLVLRFLLSSQREREEEGKGMEQFHLAAQGEVRPRRGQQEGADRITHANASLVAGVCTAVTVEAAALVAGFQLGAALSALAGAHQTA